MFGLCATALVTDVIQLATGYHAPFFLTVCKPNYTLLGTPCDANPYITQDICSGTDKHAILSARYVPGGDPCRDANPPAPSQLCPPSPRRKTFPSQHATLSAFAAVYVSVSSRCRSALGPACAGSGQRELCAIGQQRPSPVGPPPPLQRQALPDTRVPAVRRGCMHTRAHTRARSGTLSSTCTQEPSARPGAGEWDTAVP